MEKLTIIIVLKLIEVRCENNIYRNQIEYSFKLLFNIGTFGPHVKVVKNNVPNNNRSNIFVFQSMTFYYTNYFVHGKWMFINFRNVNSVNSLPCEYTSIDNAYSPQYLHIPIEY